MSYVPNKFNAVDVAQKNVQGMEQYMEHAQTMMLYFNNSVLKDKLAIKALIYYKSMGYTEINQFLLNGISPQIQIPLGDDQKYSREDIEELRKKAMAEYIKVDLKQLVKHISKLDEMICNAPKMFTVPTKVYRGMGYDIQRDMECVNGKYFYTFNNYTSTSFTPSVSKTFMWGPGSVLYTLILDSKCKGIYVNFGLGDNVTAFQELMIDSEVEFIIGRGAKFEVVSTEVLPLKTNTRLLRYKDIACRKLDLFYSKHYTLKFVSQLTLDDLENNVQEKFKAVKKDLPRLATFTI